MPPAAKLVCRVERLPLNAGRYTFTIYSTVGTIIADWITDAAAFHVVPGDFYGTGRLPADYDGHVLVEQTWAIEGSTSHETSLTPKSSA